MDVRELLERATEGVEARRVFGEAYERDGATIVPVAAVMGGGGGGEGNRPDGEAGRGAGFGMRARPVGVYVISGGDVRWEPAVDVTRLLIGAQVLLGLLLVRRLFRRR